MTEPRRPSAIPGYTHPEKTRYSRAGMYKTFTEGAKPRKKEKFGTTTIATQYASSKELESDKAELTSCPICKAPPVNVCPCGYNDKTCKEGHVWFTDRDGKTKSGNPH